MVAIMRINWPLWMGLLVIGAVLVLAFIGPSIAPMNPQVPNFFTRAGREWYKPPFPPLTVPGYPLGSDSLGRDVLSRLLWAIRPTVQVLGVIALARLAVGAAVGLAAGWSKGEAGRTLNSLISAALAAPVLVVALLMVAALEEKLGVRAFILGLCLTGWAEVARAVREQTRLIKGQSYVEAAHALGASGLFVVIQHVLRQILPLLWVLGAFEVSSTLLTLGTLGFLGYYIGGDAWIDIDDVTSARVSAMPELGQMLAGDSTEFFFGPWKMFAAGTVVVLIILGFNLLGSGLQRAMEQHRFSYSPFLSLLYRASAAARWVAQPIQAGLRRLPQPPPRVRRVLPVLLIVVGIAGVMGWREYQSRRAVVERPALVASVLEEGGELPVPGGHHWASAARDPYGTRWNGLRGPGSGRVAWRFEVEAGFAGGPAVAADGTLYIGANDARLYAVSPAGEEQWQVELPTLPVGAPALAADGTIYVADAEGALAAFSAEGTLLWRVEGEGSTLATPIAAPDGTIFYATGDHVRAIGPDGTLRWESEWLPGAAPEAALMLDPSGTWLFAGQSVLQASDGQAAPNLNLQAERFLVGADSALYFQPRAKALVRWEMNENGYPAVLERVAWRDNSGGTALPPAIGVAPDGHLWYQANLESQFRLAWLTPTGRASGLYSTMLRNARLVGLDRFGTAFACGQRGNLSLICVAVPANGTREAWHLDLPSSGRVVGGALAPSRLYVATEGGILYAIEGR